MCKLNFDLCFQTVHETHLGLASILYYMSFNLLKLSLFCFPIHLNESHGEGASSTAVFHRIDTWLDLIKDCLTLCIRLQTFSEK